MIYQYKGDIMKNLLLILFLSLIIVISPAYADCEYLFHERFIVNEDSVTDNITGLIWVNSATEKLSWVDLHLYLKKNSNLRYPTVKELKDLNEALNNVDTNFPFVDTPLGAYWAWGPEQMGSHVLKGVGMFGEKDPEPQQPEDLNYRFLGIYQLKIIK
jgi:hypothetical protein